MISNEFKTELKAYLEENYISPDFLWGGNLFDETCNSALYNNQNNGKTTGFSIDDVLEDLGESFHDFLFAKIDESGMTDVEVYKRAGLDRKLFSKIRSNQDYHPRKQTVLALAIALNLSIKDTQSLLARAEYAFSPSSKGDLIVKFFIEHEKYELDAINLTLFEYDLPILE